MTARRVPLCVLAWALSGCTDSRRLTADVREPTAFEFQRAQASFAWQSTVHGVEVSLPSRAQRLSVRTASIARAGYQAVSSDAATQQTALGWVRELSGCRELVRERPQSLEQTWEFARRPPGKGALQFAVQLSLENDPAPRVAVTRDGLELASQGAKFRYGHGTWIDALGVRTPVPVTWRDGVALFSVPQSVVDGSAYPARLDPLVGPVIPGAPPARDAAGEGVTPRVAFDGTNYLTVFEDNGRIRAALISALGELQSAWIDLGEYGVTQVNPSVAFNGERYLVVWAQAGGAAGGLFARALDPSGELLSEANVRLVEGAEAALPQVIAQADDWLISYWDQALSTLRVDDELSVLADAPQVISPPIAAVPFRMARSMEATWVVFEDEVQGVPALYSVQIDAHGSALDAAPVLVRELGGALLGMDLAASSNAFFVVSRSTEDAQALNVDVLPREGNGGAASAFTFALPGTADGLAVAYDGTQFLATWTDTAAEPPVLLGVRFSEAGDVLDSEARMLAEISSGTTAPELATATGENTLLVAFQASGIRGVLLDSDLDVIDTGEFSISALPSDQGPPAISYDGQRYVVAWAQAHGNAERDNAQTEPAHSDYLAQVISPDGQLLSAPPIAVKRDVPGALSIASASVSGKTLLAWVDSETAALQFRILDAAGELTAVTTLENVSAHGPIALAASADQFLLAHSATLESGGGAWGTLISSSGKVLTPHIQLLSEESALPARVCTAGDWFVTALLNDGKPRLVGVSREGTPSTPLILSEERSFVSCAGGEQVMAVSWTEWESDPAHLRGRLLDGTLAWRTPAFFLSAESNGYPAAMTWNGQAFSAIWESQDGLMHRVFDGDGTASQVQSIGVMGAVLPSLVWSTDRGLLGYLAVTASQPARRLQTRLFEDDEVSEFTALPHAVPGVLSDAGLASEDHSDAGSGAPDSGGSSWTPDLDAARDDAQADATAASTEKGMDAVTRADGGCHVARIGFNRRDHAPWTMTLGGLLLASLSYRARRSRAVYNSGKCALDR